MAVVALDLDAMYLYIPRGFFRPLVRGGYRGVLECRGTSELCAGFCGDLAGFLSPVFCMCLECTGHWLG